MGPIRGSGRSGRRQAAVVDYIAMTDRYAVKLFRDIYLPRGWEKFSGAI